MRRKWVRWARVVREGHGPRGLGHEDWLKAEAKGIPWSKAEGIPRAKVEGIPRAESLACWPRPWGSFEPRLAKALLT